MAMPLWLREKLFQKSLLKKQLKAYAPPSIGAASPLYRASSKPCRERLLRVAFEEAVVLTMDGWGVGDHLRQRGTGHHLEMRKEIHFPHSLGLLARI